MRCKACNSEIDLKYRKVETEVGKVLVVEEDLCPTCLREVNLPIERNLMTPHDFAHNIGIQLDLYHDAMGTVADSTCPQETIEHAGEWMAANIERLLHEFNASLDVKDSTTV